MKDKITNYNDNSYYSQSYPKKWALKPFFVRQPYFFFTVTGCYNGFLFFYLLFFFSIFLFCLSQSRFIFINRTANFSYNVQPFFRCKIISKPQSLHLEIFFIPVPLFFIFIFLFFILFFQIKRFPI